MNEIEIRLTGYLVLLALAACYVICGGIAQHRAEKFKRYEWDFLMRVLKGKPNVSAKV